jgi:hypothetical protein
VVEWTTRARAHGTTRASNVDGEKRGEMARLTLVDGLEALLLLVDPVGLHELELPALVRVPGRRHRCEQIESAPAVRSVTGGEVRRKRRECDTHERRRVPAAGGGGGREVGWDLGEKAAEARGERLGERGEVVVSCRVRRAAVPVRGGI